MTLYTAEARGKISSGPVYTFQVTQRVGFLRLGRETRRFVLDTKRPDVSMLLNTRQWDTPYRSPLPSQQEKFSWKEYYSTYYLTTEGDSGQYFVEIGRFASSSQAEYGRFLELDELMDVLETAEQGHLTKAGKDFIKTHDRRIPV